MKRIFTWLRYSFLLVRKNVFLTILVILQLALTVFGVATLCRFSFTQGSQVKYAEQLAANGSVYSIISKEKMDSLKDVEVAVNQSEGGVAIKGQGIIASMYPARIHEFLDLPLYKGRWFDASTDGAIEIVVSQSCNLKLGEQVSMQFLNKTVSGVVAGILPKKATVLELGGGSASPDWFFIDNLFRSLEEDEKVLYFSREQMIAKGLQPCFVDSGAYYIRFKDGISEENLQYNYEILRNNGYTATIDKIISNTEKDSNMLLMMFVPIVVLLVAMILLSTLMVVLLISYSSKKLLSTIYLYGAYESDVYGMMFLLGLIMTVIADVIYFIADKLLMGEFIINFGSDYRHLIAVFLINIVQVGLITLLSKKAIKKKNMLSSLREEL